MSALHLILLMIAIVAYCCFSVRRGIECHLCKGNGVLPHQGYIDDTGHWNILSRKCLRCGGTGRS